MARLVLALLLGAPISAFAESVPEPAGYRMSDYRSAVPSTIEGGRVVDTTEAANIWKAKSAVFVDMLPRPEKPKDFPAGTIWRDKPRHDIPGSIWLANTGYGALSEGNERRFSRSLEQATGGDRSKPLVFYCLADCWMSWNGAKRAISLGYTNVMWYPDGTDGWSQAGLPLEPREPFAEPWPG